MLSALKILTAIMYRDLLIGWRGLSDVLAGVGFFAVIVALLPLAIGPAPQVLEEIAPMMIWVAALIASLPQMERFFSRDANDGSLNQLILTPLPLPLVVIAKIKAAWILIMLPLVLATPLLALMLGLPFALLPILISTVIIGSVGLILLGSMAAAITLGARRSATLIAVLTLPLSMPILIFASTTLSAALREEPTLPHLALLSATTLVLVAIAPLATAIGLRIAAEHS